jgi:predicted secreted hydrolase
MAKKQRLFITLIITAAIFIAYGGLLSLNVSAAGPPILSNDATLTVTAEDSTTQDYTITITRHEYKYTISGGEVTIDGYGGSDTAFMIALH